MSPKKKRVNASSHVKVANEATAAKLAETLPTCELLKDTKFHFQLKRASELSADEREAIWSLADTNMRDLASQSSMGWHEHEKKEELFDPALSRFIIARTHHDALDQDQEPAGAIAAYTMFRFEYEEGERLLYCYEVQIAEAWRRYGLGRFLVNQLRVVGRKWRMEKIMLTVLKANNGAHQFYTAMGFIKDESSPDYVPEGGEAEEAEECDYDIMSLGL